MEKDLAELVERLKSAIGANLKTVVLYGSAAAGDFQPQHSDLNVLCVLDRLDGAELQKLGPTARWWEKKVIPRPSFSGSRSCSTLRTFLPSSCSTFRRSTVCSSAKIFSRACACPCACIANRWNANCGPTWSACDRSISSRRAATTLFVS